MRSSVGVGITPPKVLGTPKPESSVIISKMLGAPFGGTTRAGQYGVDSAVLRPIFPSNFCGGGGSCLPSIVVVAQGEPGGQFACWACATPPASKKLGMASAPSVSFRTPAPKSILLSLSMVLLNFNQGRLTVTEELRQPRRAQSGLCGRGLDRRGGKFWVAPKLYAFHGSNGHSPKFVNRRFCVT